MPSIQGGAREIAPFNQPSPELGNQFDDDRVLRSYLRWVLPPEVHKETLEPLRELGDLAGDKQTLALHSRAGLIHDA